MALGWRKNYLRYQGYFLNVLSVYQRRQDVKIFLELLLSLTTVIFFLVFALKPTVITVINLYKDVKAKEALVALMDQKIDDLQKAYSLLNAQADKIPLIFSSVPQNPSPETLIRQIEGLAGQTSVNLSNVSVEEEALVSQDSAPSANTQNAPAGEEKLSSSGKFIFFSTKVSGDYSQISQFLKNLENLRRPISFQSIKISTVQTEGITNNLSTLVSGKAPYLQK